MFRRSIKATSEETKYKKKKGSSVSRAEEKVTHKHDYGECIIMSVKPFLARYCRTCGKVRDIQYFPMEKKAGRICCLSDKQVLEKAKGLPLFRVDNTATLISVDLSKKEIV